MNLTTGERIRVLARRRGYILDKDIAALLGVSKSCFAHWVAGRHEPRPTKLQVIVRKLRLRDLSDFWQPMKRARN